MEDFTNLVEKLKLVEENFLKLHKNLKRTTNGNLRMDSSFMLNLEDETEEHKVLIDHYDFYVKEEGTVEDWSDQVIATNQFNIDLVLAFNGYNKTWLPNYLKTRRELLSILKTSSRYKHIDKKLIPTYKELRKQIELNLKAIQHIKQKYIK